MKKLIYLMLTMAVGITSLCGCGSDKNKVNVNDRKVETEKKEETNLLVYAGAGLKKAMEELKSNFEKNHKNVKLDITYAGSGKLLAQLEASKKGDVFIVGAKKDFDKAEKNGLVKDGVPVADHTPTIIVKKGNPLKINSVKDLQKRGIKIVIADPKSAPIGDRALKIFTNAGLKDIDKNIVTKVENLPAIVSAVDSGNADVGIATLDSVFENHNLDKILIPKDINVGMVITAGVCTTSKHEKEANDFKNFIVSKEGRNILESHGFYYLEK